MYNYILVPVVNFLIDILYIIASTLLKILPSTPFKFEPLEWGEFGKAVTYFIPVHVMITHFVLLLSAILIYYGIRWLLRLIRQIQ